MATFFLVCSACTILYVIYIYRIILYVNYCGYWPLYWLHRGRLYLIHFGPNSRAKWSRNQRIGLNCENGILIKNRRIGNKNYNTDTFNISKLYLFRTNIIQKQPYKYST